MNYSFFGQSRFFLSTYRLLFLFIWITRSVVSLHCMVEQFCRLHSNFWRKGQKRAISKKDEYLMRICLSTDVYIVYPNTVWFTPFLRRAGNDFLIFFFPLSKRKGQTYHRHHHDSRMLISPEDNFDVRFAPFLPNTRCFFIISVLCRYGYRFE